MSMIRNAIAAIWGSAHNGMSTRERDAWGNATTLQDLGRLTMEWLDGHTSGTPGHPDGTVDVDEDIAPGLTDALVDLNLNGFLTVKSEGGYDFGYMVGEAWVSGYADDDTYEWLTSVVDGTPYGIWAWPPANDRSPWRRTQPVGDIPIDGGGDAVSAEDIRWAYRECTAQAIDAVCSAWQVTVYDPAPGRNDMWAHLQQAAEDRPMPDQDWDQWKEARTLPDLADLTAMWLDGRIAGQPGYDDPCDVDEYDAPGLTAALIALNHIGFLTMISQAAQNGQLAAVVGFTDEHTLIWLRAVTRNTGIEILEWQNPDQDAPLGYWSEDYLRECWLAGCSQEAVDDVWAACQVTIYDPEPGRNDMWELLRQAAEDR